MERDLSKHLDAVDAVHSQVEELIMQVNTAYDEGYAKAIDEFAEKLIGRLKAGVDKECVSNVLKIRLCDAITIVNELAEEHKGGWIPCSERLPETNESVLCWAKSTARGGDVCFVGSCHNGFWFLQSSADTHSFPGQYVIVAWQPLPDPYKEEKH